MNNSQVPNQLTVARIILIPIFVLFYYLPVSWGHLVAAGIFALAAITDWLDGYLARMWNITSRFGEFLDPVADKVMVAVALVIVVSYHGTLLLAIPGAIIVAREIIVSGLREWMAEIGKRASVQVSYIGKLKTTLQMIALIILIVYRHESGWLWQWIGGIFLYIAAGLTLWSMFLYIQAAWSDLTLSYEKE